MARPSYAALEPARMIDVELLCHRGSFTLDVGFTTPADGVTAVFGASGAGKSTLLDLLVGSLQPKRGRIVIGDRVLLDTGRRIHIPTESRSIGWVPQDGLLFPNLKVLNNLRYGARRTLRIDEALEARVIDTLGLDSLLERWPRDLSGGERQRVALGRALLASPQLLLLDEPLAAVDAARKAEILVLLESIKREFRIPVLHVTHSLAEVLRLADHLVLLDRGQVLAHGPIENLIGRADTPLLAMRADVGSLLTLELKTSAADSTHGLADLDGHTIRISPLPADVKGPLIRAYVPANEVIIATQAPQGISVRNILPARILQLRRRNDGSVLIELAVGKQRLLAAVTDAAVRDLGLVVDRPVFALVKSMSLDAPAGLRLLETG